MYIVCMLLVRVITEFVRVCTFTCRSVTGFLGSNPVFSPGNLMITTVVSTVAATIATQSVPYCFAQQFLRRQLLLLFYRLQLGFLWVHIWVRDSSQSLWSWLKILHLKFVEMQKLMPETWLREEEETTKNTIAWPKHHSAPVTDILQWL